MVNVNLKLVKDDINPFIRDLKEFYVWEKHFFIELMYEFVIFRILSLGEVINNFLFNPNFFVSHN